MSKHTAVWVKATTEPKEEKTHFHCRVLNNITGKIFKQVVYRTGVNTWDLELPFSVVEYLDETPVSSPVQEEGARGGIWVKCSARMPVKEGWYIVDGIYGEFASGTQQYWFDGTGFVCQQKPLIPVEHTTWLEEKRVFESAAPAVSSTDRDVMLRVATESLEKKSLFLNSWGDNAACVIDALVNAGFLPDRSAATPSLEAIPASSPSTDEGESNLIKDAHDFGYNQEKTTIEASWEEFKNRNELK